MKEIEIKHEYKFTFHLMIKDLNETQCNSKRKQKKRKKEKNHNRQN